MEIYISFNKSQHGCSTKIENDLDMNIVNVISCVLVTASITGGKPVVKGIETRGSIVSNINLQCLKVE